MWGVRAGEGNSQRPDGTWPVLGEDQEKTRIKKGLKPDVNLTALLTIVIFFFLQAEDTPHDFTWGGDLIRAVASEHTRHNELAGSGRKQVGRGAISSEP